MNLKTEIGTIQNEAQKEKKLRIKQTDPRDLWDNTKWFSMHEIGIPGKNKGEKNIWGNSNKIFSIPYKNCNPNIQEVEHLKHKKHTQKRRQINNNNNDDIMNAKEKNIEGNQRKKSYYIQRKKDRS